MKTVIFPRSSQNAMRIRGELPVPTELGSAGVPPALAGVPPTSRAQRNAANSAVCVRNRGPRRDRDRGGRAPRAPTNRDGGRRGGVLNRSPEAGVALVITLIMLAVITFMAVTFLVLSRREKGQVTTTTDQAVATFAMQAAMNRALSEEIGRTVFSTNDQAYGMLVSTNYINWLGFTPNSHSPTNVNYSYLRGGGGALTLQEQQDNIGNLMFDPRPPVYIPIGTNTIAPDFRYYLDLNRNGRYDTNGYWPVMSGIPGLPYYSTSGVAISSANPIPGNVAYSWFIGDPEWIGVLERPDLPHSATNRFIGRYAYMVLPAGKTLDLNYIHNQALLAGSTQPFSSTLALTEDGYLRNQGVGTWEINLASFLMDLNTNQWNSYSYNRWRPDPNVPANNPANQGRAFSDAYSLIAYRYNFNYLNLPFATVQLPNAVNVFPYNGIDEYSDGPLMTTTAPIIETAPQASTARPWVGSDNPNHVFSSQDYFDPTKIASAPVPTFDFAGRLVSAGTNNDSYDRYTFYRMLSQLGTDGDTESGKINVNYANSYVVTPLRGPVTAVVVPGAEQNLQSWTPTNFFLAAAQKLFDSSGIVPDLAFPTAPHPLGPTWIPIWPVNRYTPAVHRLLQEAANIYDATGQTNRPGSNPAFGYNPFNPPVLLHPAGYPQAPTVFRPIIRYDPISKQVVITGYREVLDDKITAWGFPGGQPMLNVNSPTDRSAIKAVGVPPIADASEPMVYGVPLVIGAKKGYPNFNELSASTLVSALRMLQFRCPLAPDTNAPIQQTNVMYLMGISNFLGIEAWNSYSNAFPRPLQLLAMADVSEVMTNDITTVPFLSYSTSLVASVTYPANTWQGYPASNPQTHPSFQVPIYSNYLTLPISSYFVTQQPNLETPWTTNFLDKDDFHVPRWYLNLDVRLRFVLLDTSFSPSRIVDYVNIDTGGNVFDLTSILQSLDEATQPVGKQTVLPPTGTGATGPVYLWDTNRVNPSGSLNSLTAGIYNQILVGAGLQSVTWNAYNQNPVAGGDPLKAQQGFYFNLFGRNNAGDDSPHTRQALFYDPYVPYATIQFPLPLQVNDPLVHYTLADLTDLSRTNTYYVSFGPGQTTNANLGKLNDRYEPWSGNQYANSQSPTIWDLSVKDPGVRHSDDWDFPTNRLPNIGWLGRIHRGTPWQTIYMKATNILATTTNLVQNAPRIPRLGAWTQWIGNSNAFDAFFQAPVNDQKLFDIFTAVPNENAGRGRMSINEDGLAGWSATLAGVQVLTNNASDATLLNLFSSSGVSAPIPMVNFPIQPAGPYANAAAPQALPALVQIVNGINRVRTNLYSGTFTSQGNLLSVPELAEESPFLNLPKPQVPGGQFMPGRNNQYKYGVNDEMMERIPQQMMGLVGLSHTPRMVIYVWGQALRPAENSIITYNSGLTSGHQGLCTNYQVTAEVAARAVVRIEGLQTNSLPGFPPNQMQPRVIIENYNILPPDQ